MSLTSKLSIYKDRIIELINEFGGAKECSPSEVGRKLAEEQDLQYTDNIRMYVYRQIRSMNGEPPQWSEESNPVPRSNAAHTTYEENKTKGEAHWQYKGEEVITSLEQAVKFSKVDMKKWEVDRHVFNSWDVTMKDAAGNPVKRTNYQVKVWFKKRKEIDEKALEDFKIKISKALKASRVPRKIKRKAGKKKIGFIPIADLHIGAYIRNLILTQNFDVETVVRMLDEVAEEINSQNYSEVHLAIVGDVIESFTGKNHPNSFQSIGYGQTGFTLFTGAYEILENFLLKINNLKKVYCVSGNHDRYTSSNKEDTKGEVMQGLAYFLGKFLPVPVEYDPLVITTVVDNICYIITHGHHGFTQKNIEKIILDYGIQGMFNVVIKGHWHTRKKNEVLVRVETIIKDTSRYRGYVCPSLFTGNFYSEAAGFSSVAGFLQFWNKKDIPACLDTPIG